MPTTRRSSWARQQIRVRRDDVDAARLEIRGWLAVLPTVPDRRPDPRKRGTVLALFPLFPSETRQFGVDLRPSALAERTALAEPLEHVASRRVVAEHHGFATVSNIHSNTVARSTDRAPVTR